MLADGNSVTKSHYKTFLHYQGDYIKSLLSIDTKRHLLDYLVPLISINW